MLTEQSISVENEGEALPWRRIQLVLDEPTRDGLTQLSCGATCRPRSRPSRLPTCTGSRWRIEGLFGRD